ncbi:MAG TPA: N-6 DNA methylase [Polyangiaceae bacterium]|nr:N-6 DNA methylase [Polyangiaceae bacterium]
MVRTPGKAGLPLKDRRTVLKQLSRDRLAELTTGFALEVTDRRSTDAHVEAIVRKRSLPFRSVLEALPSGELKAISHALHGSSGGDKAALIDRLLGVSVDAEGVGEADAAPRAKRAATAPASDTALKSHLRRFVLEGAGGFRGRDPAGTFTTKLLECFGWPGGAPPEATMPAELAVVDGGKRATRAVALSWSSRRLLVEVVNHDVMLDYAWKDLLRVCLQVDPVPQYVVLTNQRDLRLYDLGRDRETPRLAISVDDLPKYSEAFPFLSPSWVPGTTPTIINVSKVSGQVAELVAKLYRSLKQQHPERERDVVQFSLQCILTMFAEDIGLLPQEYFTTLLYDGARHGDVEKRLADLFRLMSTRDVPGGSDGERAVPFFNGGLFTKPVTVPLGEAQLAALTKASEANWKYVDPHIFGSVFQGIMNDAERHKSGAHYTAHDDIMRVVGPTIVEPWRARIREAKTKDELLAVRAELLTFRVLDPACGSGNFLYIAFRELYKLDTELLVRLLKEFPSTQGLGRQSKAKVSWGVGIQASRFYGLDINPFAVELAKVTLNIAKKIAFDERREIAADYVEQIEIDVDPSLPLDNLDKNIVCADALFTEWPEVDAIVGNPPFLGDRKIRGELGADYIRKLQDTSGIDGVVDLCCYWFRRAHDRLKPGARAGLVGTSGIRVGKAREASLDYVVANGGTITNAVSSRLWPGDAALNVSMVNWVKGPATPPHQLFVDEHAFDLVRISTHLQLHTDLSDTRTIAANALGTAMGVIFGSDLFVVEQSRELDSPKLRGRGIIRPIAAGTALVTGHLQTAPSECIYLGSCTTESEVRKLAGDAYKSLITSLRPYVESVEVKYPGWSARWWQQLRPQRDFFDSAWRKARIVACSSPQSRPIFVFLSTTFVPTNTLQLFAFDDDYSFGIIQSELHWVWTKAKGGKVRSDIRYTSDVWRTFPWPQEPSEPEALAVAEAARNLRKVRDMLMSDNGWSLRALYQAAEIPGYHPLKAAQAALDEAVRNAYGMPEGQEPTEFLLELNKLVAEDEAEGREVQGPGLPRGVDPKDPRFTSTDCIEPPRGPGQ